VFIFCDDILLEDVDLFDGKACFDVFLREGAFILLLGFDIGVFGDADVGADADADAGADVFVGVGVDAGVFGDAIFKYK
jgi:hypothetical protein